MNREHRPQTVRSMGSLPVRADRRIAVTGATSALGQVLRTALAQRGVPLEQILLLDQPSEEAILSEYSGEPTLVLGLDPESLADADCVILCGTAEESLRCLEWKRRKDAVVVDLSGASAGAAQAPVVNLAVNPGALDARPGVIAAPHAISFALTSALAPIEAIGGVRSAAGVVLRPASDFGQAGIEELHRQTVSLLNFTDLPKNVFHRQIAFNLLPESAVRENRGAPRLHARIALESARVLGWDEPRATVRLLVAPVFHGHSVLMHVLTREPATPAAIRKALGAAAGLTLRHGVRAEPSPAELADREEELAVDAGADETGGGGFWISMVGAQLREAAARNAVEIAARLLSG